MGELLHKLAERRMVQTAAVYAGGAWLMLEATDFFWPEDKRQSLSDNLHNLLHRLPLNDTDIRTLHGVFRALAENHPVRKKD